MSHFSVMVVTDTEPTEDTLAAVMQPYHEFECTGDDDQYVQDVDDTAELRQQYETYERMMIRTVQARKPNWDLPKIGDSSIEEWIDAAPLLCCFAVVMGGKWYEKGKMGWWACVTNELDCWEEKFDGLFRSLNPDQWIAILDCHI
jgi:hypothetical protein